MTTLSRKARLDALKRRAGSTPEAKSEEELWDDMYQRMRSGNVLPILGGAVRLKRIYGLEHTDVQAESDAGNDEKAAAPSAANSQDEDQNLEPESQILMDLSELWAEELGYPLQESRNLARVAQYNKVISQDTFQEKMRFLTFLKESILDLAEKYDPSVQDGVLRLRQEYRSNNLSFADIVTELDYPRYSDRPDPLRVLARFRLPIYVTTSYFDFIERALKAEGAAKVRTQFCLWNIEESQVEPEMRPDPNYTPTPEEPLVYHLFGLERYPQSLVLSEDDYLDFLLALAKDFDTEKHLLPLKLRGRLEECSLLLMGFRLADWEFRVLFRGLINLLHGGLRDAHKSYSIAIQLNPRYQEPVADEVAARQYLKRYFEKSRFQVIWMSTDRYIHSLWGYWDRRRRGEI
jgi:hypothetical protein